MSLEQLAAEEMQRRGMAGQAKTEKYSKQYEKTSTSNTSNTSKGFEGVKPAPNQHLSNTKTSTPSIDTGFLVNEIKTKDGEKKSLLIESKAALIVKEALSGYFAHDINSQTWHKFVGTHWLPLDAHQFFDNALIDLLYVGAGDLGFKPAYKNGIKSLLADGDMLPLPKTDSGKLPFINGLLDLQTRTLELT